MPAWKKSFRSLPPRIVKEISDLETENAKVLAGKLVSIEDVANGLYEHLGLDADSLFVGNTREVVPRHEQGTRSKRNSEGWVNVRKDLPKYRKYFYHDIAIYGDAARNGWTTVAIPRDVYERDEFPPYLFQIEINVQEQTANGDFGIVFSVDEVFLTSSDSFEEDILFAVNLLQENTGVSGIVSADDPDFVFSSDLNWSLFPPGEIEEVVRSLSEGQRAIPEGTVRERLELFQQFEPTEYLRGLGGNDHYIGAKYADDLVVFENLKHGNALYALYNNCLSCRESNY